MVSDACCVDHRTPEKWEVTGDHETLFRRVGMYLECPSTLAAISFFFM
jgi:hypothetical protein